MFGAAKAQGAVVTVGSPLTANFTPATFNSVGTVTNAALPELGSHAASPVSGTIVRWRVADASGGPFKLRVLTPDGGTTYTGAGTSAPETPSSTSAQTFATSLPITAGQVIGLDNASGTDQIGVASAPGAQFIGWVPPLADGSTAAGMSASGSEVAFNADVQPFPTVSSISPSSGPASGATTVTVTGTNFEGTTAVSFGSTPAVSFTVVSDTTITAVAPAGSGAVDVTVRNPAQSATSAADRFVYIPLPAVASVSPSHGFRTGGQTVRIAGSGFTGATAVSFGGKRAKRFIVNSDSSITAVSPARAVGAVDVTVTTPGGTSATTGADKFRFQQVCVAPKLKGKTLKAARKALTKAHCVLGKVKGPKDKTARVKQQKPKPGKIMPARAKVNVTMKP